MHLQFNLVIAESKNYVGSRICKSCHIEQYEKWSNSHHDLAMQNASNKTILGNFEHQTFTYFGTTTTFFQKGEKYFVNTDGPDGKLTTYEIKYTFGVYPLQQYLIELKNGYVQSLGIAWDSRAKEDGGQRWFHLYPDNNIAYDNPLHWTGLDQNWNYMCAECHSTDLKKNFNIKTNQYETTWSEINVACEACHGPGGEHINWAATEENKPKLINNGLLVHLNNSASWIINPDSGLASRADVKQSDVEIETCARCHSRRSAQWDEYEHGKPLLDTHIPAVLSEGLYFADGQINDEVYVYGSFLQSKMYQRGVTCSDCHNPHSLQLKAEGNELCGTCHLASKFDTPKHHFHETGSNGAECTACHMTEKHFMVIDARADHSFRIPRPDVSIKINSPNACTQCHVGQSNEWASAVIKEWYPNSLHREKKHYGENIFAGRHGMLEANQLLIDLANESNQPSIVRATSTSLLQNYLNPYTIATINEQLHNENALIRFYAISIVEQFPSDVKLKMLKHLLVDEHRMIRIEAARALADSQGYMPNETLNVQFDKAIDEYITAQYFNAERPEAHANLGALYMSMQNPELAQSEYEKAILIDPNFIPAYINLADLYRARQMDDKAKDYLYAAIEKRPDAGSAYHSLGLLYVREKNVKEALVYLKEATEIDPENTRFKYVYAVALDSAGSHKLANDVLKDAHEARPADRDVLYALISYNQREGNTKEARFYAQILVEVSPWDQNAQALLKEL